MHEFETRRRSSKTHDTLEIDGSVASKEVPDGIGMGFETGACGKRCLEEEILHAQRRFCP